LLACLFFLLLDYLTIIFSFLPVSIIIFRDNYLNLKAFLSNKRMLHYFRASDPRSFYMILSGSIILIKINLRSNTDWLPTRCQFHQHLHACFSYERCFGSFFLSMDVPMYVKKAAETTYVRKTHTRLTLMKLTEGG